MVLRRRRFVSARPLTGLVHDWPPEFWGCPSSSPQGFYRRGMMTKLLVSFRNWHQTELSGESQRNLRYSIPGLEGIRVDEASSRPLRKGRFHNSPQTLLSQFRTHAHSLTTAHDGTRHHTRPFHTKTHRMYLTRPRRRTSSFTTE
jgi:hypothetical protein